MFKNYCALCLMSCFLWVGFSKDIYAKDTNSVLLSSLPKSCFFISFLDLNFALSIPLQQLTESQKNKLTLIFREALVQRCTLQIQYESFLQSMINHAFETDNISSEQLNSFWRDLSSISEGVVMSKLRVVQQLHRILSDNQWNIIISNYQEVSLLQDKLLDKKQEMNSNYAALAQLMSRDHLSLIAFMNNQNPFKNQDKLAVLQKLIVNIELTNSQRDYINAIINKLIIQQNINVKDQRKIIGKLLHILSQLPDNDEMLKIKPIVNRLVTKSYLENYYQIDSMIRILSILTIQQKMQLREKYIMMKTFH